MNVLTTKGYKEYSKVSRYSQIPYYYHTLDDKYISGKAAHLKTDTVYTMYTVKKNDTFDSLALEFYNNPTLFWIICSFNNIQDPFSKLIPGQLIKIPSLSNIEFDI
jgi:nucleoid-associated protein YgaU